MHTNPQTALLSALTQSQSDRCAIVFKDRRVSYDELQQLTWQVVWFLRQKGVGRGDRVGVWLKKTPESVAVVLAAMAVGGAYVPIDPDAPLERVRTLLDDCRPRVLFTGEENRDQGVMIANGLVGVEFVYLPRRTLGYDLGGVARGEEKEEAAKVRSSDVAAILYTSGSTGKPKGVMLSHGNISVFVDWSVDKFKLTSSDRVTSHAPFHFDLSTFDLYATFQAGGTVVLLDEVGVKYPGAVAKVLEEERITAWYSVPTALRLLVERGGLGRRDLGFLRLVLFAGEVFQPGALRAAMDALPTASFWNLYGPTETNVCTYYEVARPLGQAVTAIPIGQPCRAGEVKICDEQGNLVTKGEMGEICVFGPCVMLGYWEQREKTETSRVFGRIDSYRTGDFGYETESGDIMFGGRKDSQVKFRGHRIELLEIEAVVSSCPGIDEAAAVIVVEGDSTQYLHVFAVVGSTGESPTSGSVKEHVVSRLPAYCLPDEVFLVNDFPRTSTGKIDRKRLTATRGA